MDPQRRSRTTLLISVFAVLTLAQHPALAQNDSPTPIHWAYAAFYGTGRYSVDATTDVYTLGFTPGWRIREADFNEDAQRTAGIEFRLPIAIGVHDLEGAASLQDADLGNVGSVSVVPGVEIEIPMNRRWTLKPLVYAGYGAQTRSSDSAWIYWAGAKSKLDFTAGKTNWSLLNFLTYVGFSGDADQRGEFLSLTTGFEFQRELKRRRLGKEPVILHWHIAHTGHLNELDFGLTGSIDRLDIPREWDIGVAFSKRDNRLSFWRLSWDRIGIAARFSANGRLSGFNFTFNSLFER